METYSVSDTFSLGVVVKVIEQFNYQRIVLQFTDENLVYCVDVYSCLMAMLLNSKSPESFCFIAADSTHGSSVDDVSAQHVDGDLLIYFGSDLSGSGAMPVMVVPMKKSVDTVDCAEKITNAYDWTQTSTTIVLYEPGCYHAIVDIIALLSTSIENVILNVAALPPCADLEAWSSNAPHTISSDQAILGGLLLTPSGIQDACSVIIYIGDKAEQLDSIVLQLSQQTVLAYSPAGKVLTKLIGSNTKVFRQRYLGVQASSSASIIGIIIGSMGLTAASTRGIVKRLQAIIEAAGKKHYTFVMGRLNEAKICNFPEIDLFVFVSNEDTAVIAPKTFDRPVITPWELELGLGAREWGSSYQSNPTAILRDQAGEGDWENVLQKVRNARPEGNGLDDDECSDSPSDANGETMVLQGTRALTVFHSAAGDVFKQREYQGLVPDVAATQPLEVQPGLFGTASSYVTGDRNS